VLGAVKARPGSAEGSLTARVPAGLDSPLRAAAARFGGRDGRMLAARVEPKNGTWRRMEKPGASVLPQQSTASRFAGSLTVRAHPMTCWNPLDPTCPILVRVTTDHACALSDSTKLTASGFVLVSVEDSALPRGARTNCPAKSTSSCLERLISSKNRGRSTRYRGSRVGGSSNTCSLRCGAHQGSKGSRVRSGRSRRAGDQRQLRRRVAQPACSKTLLPRRWSSPRNSNEPSGQEQATGA
jgi:hypothetical protein